MSREGQGDMTLARRKYLACALGWAIGAALCLTGAPALRAKDKKTEGSTMAPPVFSPRGGAYATNVVVRLSSGASAATIRYTLDGSDPNETSPVYTAPIQLTNSALVRARVFGKASPASRVAAESYTLLDSDLADFSSNLPLVIINSFGTNITHEWSVAAGAQFIDSGKARARLTSPPEISSACLIHVHGRQSLRYPKNSFALKITDAEGDPNAVSILGFPAESDWVLYAPYPDKTLMRDVLAYELHGKMGHWTPRTRFVEVFVNT